MATQLIIEISDFSFSTLLIFLSISTNFDNVIYSINPNRPFLRTYSEKNIYPLFGVDVKLITAFVNHIKFLFCTRLSHRFDLTKINNFPSIFIPIIFRMFYGNLPFLQIENPIPLIISRYLKQFLSFILLNYVAF